MKKVSSFLVTYFWLFIFSFIIFSRFSTPIIAGFSDYLDQPTKTESVQVTETKPADNVSTNPFTQLLKNITDTLKNIFNISTKEVGQPSAAPNAIGNKINLIVTLTKDHKSGAIEVKSAQAIKGFYPKHPKNPKLADRYTHSLEQIINGVVVSSFDFAFDKGFKTDSLVEKDGKQIFSGTEIPYDKPQITLEIPYIDGASINIKDLRNSELLELRSTQIENALRNIKQIGFSRFGDSVKVIVGNKNINYSPDQPENDGYLNILIMSSHYTDANLFTSDATSIANYYLGYTPYSEFQSQTRIMSFFNTQETGCHIEESPQAPYIICDLDAIAAIAAAFPHDIILVVENINDFVGTAYPWARIAATTRWADVTGGRPIAIHEIGHALGLLYDEYIYDNFGPYNGEPLGPNCDSSPSCPKWNGVPGTGCFEGCSYPTGAYRPTLMSMMNSYPGISLPFYTVNEEALRDQITAFINQFDPLGIHQSSTTNCQVKGWTCDPNNLSRALRVEIKENDLTLFTPTANQFNPDAITPCQGGSHGFVTNLLFTDGQNHTITVKAKDIDGSGNQTGRIIDLEQTPRTVFCPARPSPTPSPSPSPSPNVACTEIQAWRDDPRNIPGNYYLTTPIDPDEGLGFGERFVFGAHILPENLQITHRVSYLRSISDLTINDYSSSCAPGDLGWTTCNSNLTNANALVRATVTGTPTHITVNGIVSGSGFTAAICPNLELPVSSGNPSPPLRGDANGDGHVNYDDWDIVHFNFGRTGECGNQGDLDGDCDVDVFDMNLVVEDYGL